VTRTARAIAVALAVTAGFAQAETPEESRGAELLLPFKHELQEALRLGLSKSPVDAISACRTRAPEIATALSEEGIDVGRTSDRLRNPANSSPGWVKPILEAYIDNPTERAPRAVPLPDSRLGYVEPILVQPLCLTCHGDPLAPDIAARIDELYPEDRAVGYEIGDLRGVFWIEFPAED
jgi:hypothetical protein